jgi:cytochrome c
MRRFIQFLVVVCVCALSAQAHAAKFNKWDAKRLVSKSTCFKCHSIERKKVGPAYQDVATKYRDDPEGATKIYRHITLNPEVEIDGKKEIHIRIKTDDQDDINNVVQWLLSH